jgi:hypothetical protein
MSEGYKKGDKCVKCGRKVTVEKCDVCSGTGKHWNGNCLLCGGTGKSITCPVGRYTSLSDYFKGLDCRDYAWVNGLWTKQERRDSVGCSPVL